MAWTDEKVELLRKLWSEGLSASQIANKIGDVTRNAVIGKVHRLGLEGRAKPLSRKSVTVGQLDANVISVSYSGNLAFKGTPEDNFPHNKNDIINNQENQLYIAPDEKVTILNLTENNCKWPIGDPRDDDFHFCGHAPSNGSPYCEDHSKVAYKKSKANRLTH
tara:strand:+ start:53844 stop:54332 length:489 start_codon:yes stop_codon:yes gene_type:complete